MFSSAILLLAAVSPAFATVFITHPTQAESWAAGTQQTISWQENNVAPLLPQFGPARVSIYVGSTIQQTEVQNIVPSVDVSTTSSIVFTPNPGAGENGGFYFIRFESLGAKDPNNAAQPALSFSAKFTLTGMTGTFTDAIKAQIAAGNTTNPPAANSPTTSSSTTTGNSRSTSTSSSKTSTGTPASKNNTASGSAKDDNGNGALSLSASAFTCIVGAVLATLPAMFM